jgi:hypothetical protein
MRAPPPGFSQLTASFLACSCQGIHRAPFLRLTGYLYPALIPSTFFGHTHSLCPPLSLQETTDEVHTLALYSLYPNCQNIQKIGEEECRAVLQRCFDL